ncbi:acetolactate synthase large subunit [Desulfofustis limnaeus]|jgi:acetolactate synthase-1/2/3 large subunit|uniref:Acetolactate synthase n=1 Tax=Desulfofustis limnaeus TaxID=2740163 RepID=A0ABM7W9C9_9BACT|nr:acetolactate synthase large subunit [Desulfofustis limnaeus]MDX9893974.1 acetolactate synthase large subunit [Desulfofustis sp.]BDD87504.1 acetolactate synthase [Desulfofustis limnaeus]
MGHLTGAQLTIRLLAKQGITTITGIPGGSILPLYDALYREKSIKHVLARHEQGAGFIAQGMARSSGRPAVCFATSGPGATNIVTAMADAYLDSIPVIFITGQVPLSMIGTDAFQEVDVYGLSIPITKHNYLVRSAAELLEVIPEAFQLAVTGRPGPILIDIPKDVQNELIRCDEPLPGPLAPPPQPPFDQTQLDRAVAMIEGARQPVLYLGGGVIHAGAGELARAFAEKAGLPTTMTLLGLGVIPPEHPLYLGMLGMHAARATNLAINECDLLIGVGVRFDDRATGKIAEFCPEAKIIHIDIDPCEISKLKPSNLAFVGDVKASLQALLPLITPNPRRQWLHKVTMLRSRYPLFCSEQLDFNRPYGIILRIAEIIGDEAIVTTDVGKHQMWTAQIYPFSRPRQLLTSGGLGTMGFGLPAAIGAALEHPDRPVVCFTGDGSILMNIQELATVVEQRANVKIILLNNRSLGLVRQQQRLFYGGNLMASVFEHNVDYPTIARGFGIESFDVEDPAELDSVLLTALHQPGPCLINIPIGMDEDVYPMVPPGAANSTMIGDPHVSECA